jgi:anaerobic selenocysteine-containing dehydrogenase
MAPLVQHEERLTQPLLRSGQKGAGAWAAISWTQALDTIFERFSAIAERFGSEAIAPLRYGGTMGLLAGGSMDRRFFHRLGASRVDASPLCAGTVGAAWETLFGDAGGIDFAELAQSELIVVWGNNITTCNLHLTTLIRDARHRGAALVVIDPRRTRIARDADLHIPLLPGTDVVLAYATAALLEARGALDLEFMREHTAGADAFLAAAREFPLERAAALCGIDAALIQRFATLWATRRPAAMSLGVAPERNRNGGAGIRAALSLLALTGNIGPRGAGPCDVSRFFPVCEDTLMRPDLAPAGVRELNVLDVPRLVLEPGEEVPLRGLFIYNHNPVAVHPQQSRMREALLSEELFVVGSDLLMTDSMALADLVLPAASHLEYADLYAAYGHRYLQRSAAAIPPAGQAKSNMDLFRALAARFGFEDACLRESDESLMQQSFAGAGDDHPANRAASGAVDMTPYAGPALLRGRLPGTPSGRIELFSETLERRSGDGVPRFRPLPDARAFIVVSPASEERVNSTFGSLPSQQQDLCCEIHPDDAAARGIADGDRIVLHNAQGELALPARVTDAVRRGTLFVPKGAWIRGTADGAAAQGTINALIPGHRDPLVNGACYYDCSVDIRRI